MDVHFMDTSILLNLLNVPHRNQDRPTVWKEFQELAGDPVNVLILPFAALIETGNHIAHIDDGTLRRQCAKTFAQCLEKTLDGKAPWAFYGQQFEKEDLRRLGEQFPDAATREIGFGDLSILRAYETYKARTPAIRRIRIWTTDHHLRGYDETLSFSRVDAKRTETAVASRGGTCYNRK